jgi:hypothetical protein
VIRGRLARYGQNDAYERGWQEGWAAALARVQEEGLEKVLERERLLDAPIPMTLAFDQLPREPGEGEAVTS